MSDLIKDFGVVIACCYKDYNFAKGCCASVRYFLGEVPICLIIDGTFSTRKLEKTYGVQVIDKNSVRHPELKQRSFGFGLTKMIAFWESPWEKFLFLDADTIVWGNLLNYIDHEQYDLISDFSPEDLTKDTISRFFFDVNLIETSFPDFKWQNHQYWVTGSFIAKRGIFKIKEYLELLDFHERNPNVFKLGEQGILNFMTFQAVQAGEIRLSSQKMQILLRQHTTQDLQNLFPMNSKGPILKSKNSHAVIHWAGAKPFIVNAGLFRAPMDFFRRQFIADAWGVSGILAHTLLIIEDFQRFRPKRRFIRKLFYLLSNLRNPKILPSG